jgi:hypothetical protein
MAARLSVAGCGTPMFHVEQSKCGTTVEKLWGMFHVEHFVSRKGRRGSAKVAKEIGGSYGF